MASGMTWSYYLGSTEGINNNASTLIRIHILLFENLLNSSRFYLTNYDIIINSVLVYSFPSQVKGGEKREVRSLGSYRKRKRTCPLRHPFWAARKVSEASPTGFPVRRARLGLDKDKDFFCHEATE